MEAPRQRGAEVEREARVLPPAEATLLQHEAEAAAAPEAPQPEVEARQAREPEPEPEAGGRWRPAEPASTRC